MTWPDATVVLGCLAALVGLTWVVLPYVRSRTEEQRREEALRSINKRIEVLESSAAERRMPVGLGRRSA